MAFSGFDRMQVIMEEFHIQFVNYWTLVSLNNFDFMYFI